MKDKIITCARDIYLEYGYTGFSMRKVAKCAGICAPAIYRHFSNKEALLFSLLVTGFRIFSSYLKRSENEATPLECLRRAALEYRNFALEHPGYYEIMFMSTDQMTGLKNLNQEATIEMQATCTFHHQLVANCHFKDQDTDQLALAIWAFEHGLIALFIVGKLCFDKDEFMAMYENQVNNYLSLL